MKSLAWVFHAALSINWNVWRHIKLSWNVGFSWKFDNNWWYFEYSLDANCVPLSSCPHLSFTFGQRVYIDFQMFVWWFYWITIQYKAHNKYYAVISFMGCIRLENRRQPFSTKMEINNTKSGIVFFFIQWTLLICAYALFFSLEFSILFSLCFIPFIFK